MWRSCSNVVPEERELLDATMLGQDGGPARNEDAITYLMAFNGTSPEGHYQIGLASSGDGKFWSPGRGPILSPLKRGAEIDHVKDPCLVRAGDELRIYYTAYRLAPFQLRVCVATLDLRRGRQWVRHPSNPIALGDEPVHERPCVRYDPTDTTAPWKMWFTTGPAGSNGNHFIRYTYSNDGYEWAAPVTVLERGPAGSFDSEHIIADICVEKEGVWYLWYGGHNTDRFRTGYATAPAPGGPYTKAPSNPVIERKLNEVGALTANLAKGARSVSVPTAGFHAGQVVVLMDGSHPDNWEMTRVHSIDTSNALTLADPVSRYYDVAHGARLAGLMWGHNDPRYVEWDGGAGLWKVWGTAAQQDASPGRLMEQTFYAEGPTPESLVVLEERSPVIPHTPEGRWYWRSGENPYIIRLPGRYKGSDLVRSGDATNHLFGARAAGVQLLPQNLDGSTQFGLFLQLRANREATVAAQGLRVRVDTEDANFILPFKYGIKVDRGQRGAASSIGIGAGIFVEQLDEAGVNYAIQTQGNTPVRFDGNTLARWIILDDVVYAPDQIRPGPVVPLHIQVSTVPGAAFAAGVVATFRNSTPGQSISLQFSDGENQTYLQQTGNNFMVGRASPVLRVQVVAENLGFRSGEFAGGVGVIAVADAVVRPGGAPAAGSNVLFFEGGVMKLRRSDGSTHVFQTVPE